MQLVSTATLSEAFGPNSKSLTPVLYNAFKSSSSLFIYTQKIMFCSDVGF